MVVRERRRVAVIGTGGTIASVGKNSLDTIRYSENDRRLGTNALLDCVPEAGRVADLIIRSYAARPSAGMAPQDWLGILRLTEETAANEHPDGIVITHGTATLEETAYFLNLTIKTAIPVVLVGAQRPISSISSDAAMNLVNAIRVAGSPEAQGMGVLVLLNDEIHAAREVTKASTMRTHAFRSPDFGILGHADADEISFYRRPLRSSAPHTEFDLLRLTDLPRVDIAFSYAGSDGTAIDAFVASGAAGIVSAAFAPGALAPLESQAYARASASGVVVVVSTRAGSGRVAEAGGSRPESSIPADNLLPQKARVLLMVALTSTRDPSEIRRIFARY